jgi:hypothetical protein
VSHDELIGKNLQRMDPMLKRILTLFSLPFILLIAFLCLTVSTPADVDINPIAEDIPAKALLQTGLLEQQAQSPPSTNVEKESWHKPSVIKGIYTTGWMAGSSKWFPQLVDFIDKTEFNALVIDVKDDTGTLSYRSKVPLVNEEGASLNKISNPAKMIALLREHQIYPIARIVVFKDPFLAGKRPDWAVRDINGGLWKDRRGLNWVDPNNRQVWDYIVDIAKEAIGLGFQEIQFDYVRFTSDGDLKRCVYPYSSGKLRQDVIKEFLDYARFRLKDYHVPISADIFGLTTSTTDDMGIGQKFEKIVTSVDVVCPMVYPSHYALGTFGLRNPDLNPYETVFHGVSDAKKRLEKLGNTTTQLRPWLQDFSLGNHYGRNQIQKQIQAVKDAGVKEWIFWNPSCRYDISKYN